jgi:hypothetical protein
VCSYRIRYDDHAVDCHSFATLTHPLIEDYIEDD